MDIGPNGLVNTEAVRAILARFGFTESSAPSEDAIAEILAGLLSTPGDQLGGLPPTDMTMLVQGITTFSRFVSWARIIHSLDEPEGLVIAHDVRWDSFARAMLAAPQDGHFTAISGLWGAWAHRIRQLQILNGLLSVDPELFTFVMLPGRRVVTVDEVVSANNTVKSQAANVQDSTWNALDLIETMVQVADWDEGDVRQAVAALLEKAVKANADLVLMGLIQVPRPWNAIHSELVTKLLAMFLGGHSSHQLVFYRIWQLNRNFLLNALRNYYQENPRNVARVLDVAQELKVLDADNIQRNGNEFIRAALEFLDSKVKDDLSKPDPNAESTSMPLTVQSVALFLRVLRSNGDSMTPEEIDFFKVVRNLCLQLHPRLMNLAPGTEGQEPGLQVVTFPQDVHKETDGYYRQMYEGQISIEDLISLLQRSKVSEDPGDRQIFACMVHTLFDEYRCFEMYYPPKELGMTAVVFGSLIQHQLIDFIPLGIAIRYVLDALRSPPDSNMFQFGLQALLRFEERLPEWPQLGQALMSLPIAQQGHPEIARVVRDAMQGNGATNGNGQQQVNGIVASRGEEPKVPFTAINVDPLHHEMEPSDPTKTLQTSSSSLSTISHRATSMPSWANARKLLKPELYHWFSSYLVLQRISIEPKTMVYMPSSSTASTPLRSFVTSSRNIREGQDAAQLGQDGAVYNRAYFAQESRILAWRVDGGSQQAHPSSQHRL
ncbi:hypothetical protein L7F22_031495 [Adiantum nelumboides]|nr:hypothetical protein [Adiantum nelumboides]